MSELDGCSRNNIELRDFKIKKHKKTALQTGFLKAYYLIYFKNTNGNGLQNWSKSVTNCSILLQIILKVLQSVTYCSKSF